MVADNLVYRNTNWKSNSLLDSYSVYLFVVKSFETCLKNSSSKLTEIYNLCSCYTLPNKSSQSQVDNLGCLLVFSADITVKKIEKDEICSQSLKRALYKFFQEKTTYLLERSVTSSSSSLLYSLPSSLILK